MAGASVVLAAEVGAFPAPVVRLAWALWQEGLRVDAVFVLTHPGVLPYVEEELREPLRALARASGGAVAAEARVVFASGADGEPLGREGFEGEEAAWLDARWRFWSEVRAAAGERPLVWGLASGRQRSAVAATAAMYPLLARPQDRCVEVRTDHPALESHTASPAFVYPDHVPVVVDEHGEPVRTSSVRVALIDVPLPRVADYVPHAAETFEEAFAAAAARLAESAPGTLVVDVGRSEARLGGHPLDLDAEALAWLLVLAEAACGGGDRRVLASDLAPLERAIRRLLEAAPRLQKRDFGDQEIRSFVGALRAGRDVSLASADLRRVRHRVKKALDGLVVVDRRGPRSTHRLADEVVRVIVHDRL